MKGYTLIEILIVMVIISIVSTLAVLSIGFNRNKEMEAFSHHITNLISLAEEEAILRPATLGLAFSDSELQFYEYQSSEKKWQPLKSSALRKALIPNYIELILKIEDKRVPLKGVPKIIISENGDLTPFTLSVGKKEAEPRFKIIGKANGKISVTDYEK